MYPNPAKNIIYINLRKDFNTLSNILITDVLGKEIYKFTPTNDEMEIDISKLSDGIYFVKLSSEKGIFTQKFIKE